MQEILDLLASFGGASGQQYGVGPNWRENIYGMQSSDITSGLASLYGMDESLLNPDMFQTIPKGSLEGMMGKTYSPFMQASQEPLISSLIAGSSGQKARQAAGGFAGSGGYDKFQSGIKDVYGKGMLSTITGIGEQRAKSKSSIMDLVQSWKDAAASIRFGGTTPE